MSHDEPGDAAPRTAVLEVLLGISIVLVWVLSNACYTSMAKVQSLETNASSVATEMVPDTLDASIQLPVPSVHLSPSPELQTAGDCVGSAALVLVEKGSFLRAKPNAYGDEIAKIHPGTVLAVDELKGAYWSLRSRGRRTYLPVIHTPESCKTGYRDLVRSSGSPPSLAEALRDSLIKDIAAFMSGDSVWIVATMDTIRVDPTMSADIVRTLERGRLVSSTDARDGWRAVRLIADMRFDSKLETLVPVFESGWIRSSGLSDSVTAPLSPKEREQLRIAYEQARWASIVDEIERDAQRQAEARRQRATSLWGKAIADRIMSGDVWLGMTSEMARESVGAPDDINTSVGPWGRHEQWVYERLELYLYFENGVLSSWQN